MGDTLMNKKKCISQLSVENIEKYNGPLCEGWNSNEDCVGCELDCPNSVESTRQQDSKNTAKKILIKAKEFYNAPVSAVVAFNQLLDWIKTEYELEVE